MIFYDDSPASLMLFPGSWVLQQRLMVGPAPEWPGALEQLRLQGVASVLSLCESQEPCGEDPGAAGAELVWCSCPLPDLRTGRPLPAAGLAAAVQTARALMTLHPAVYVHCRMGMERSPLVVLGVLCLEQGWDVIEGLAQLRLLHPMARPLPGQLSLLETLLSGIG